MRRGKRGTLLAGPRTALILATPLCGTILADWMPSRDILVEWLGRRDKAFKTGTVPAKTGRMACLPIGHAWASEGFFPGGTTKRFSKIFPWGAKSGEICFFPLEIKKTTFFGWNFQNPGGSRPPPAPPFRRPWGYVGVNLGPQDRRGPPANCGTHRVNCRYCIWSVW